MTMEERPGLSLPAIRAGGKPAVARALAALETNGGTIRHAALLDACVAEPGGHVLGLTGPPGVGKSTLTNALIRMIRGRGESVGVIAVDPSSRATRGALLGDRTRLKTDPEDRQLFVRSMAARDRLGGLSDHAVGAVALMQAVYDRVIVESVGIGQSEADVKTVADTVVLCIQPGSGDSLQFMKAGVMEIPDVVAVTKADVGPAARRAVADVAGALSLSVRPADAWEPPVLAVSSTSGENLADLMDAVERHRAYAADPVRRDRLRADRHRHWVLDAIKVHYGLRGLGAVDAESMLESHGPFLSIATLSERLDSLFARPVN